MKLLESFREFSENSLNHSRSFKKLPESLYDDDDVDDGDDDRSSSIVSIGFEAPQMATMMIIVAIGFEAPHTTTMMIIVAIGFEAPHTTTMMIIIAIVHVGIVVCGGNSLNDSGSFRKTP